MHQRIEQLLKRRDLTKLTSGRSYRLKTEVPLYSPDAPFHGICDAVLELEDGTYIPLEIKSGNASPHTGEIIQLCAYAVLRECQDFCVWGGYSRGSPTRLPFVVRPAWAISTG